MTYNLVVRRLYNTFASRYGFYSLRDSVRSRDWYMFWEIGILLLWLPLLLIMLFAWRAASAVTFPLLAFSLFWYPAKRKEFLRVKVYSRPGSLTEPRTMPLIRIVWLLGAEVLAVSTSARFLEQVWPAGPLEAKVAIELLSVGVVLFVAALVWPPRLNMEKEEPPKTTAPEPEKESTIKDMDSAQHLDIISPPEPNEQEQEQAILDWIISRNDSFNKRIFNLGNPDVTQIHGEIFKQELTAIQAYQDWQEATRQLAEYLVVCRVELGQLADLVKPTGANPEEQIGVPLHILSLCYEQTDQIDHAIKSSEENVEYSIKKLSSLAKEIQSDLLDGIVVVREQLAESRESLKSDPLSAHSQTTIINNSLKLQQRLAIANKQIEDTHYALAAALREVLIGMQYLLESVPSGMLQDVYSGLGESMDDGKIESYRTSFLQLVVEGRKILQLHDYLRGTMDKVGVQISG